MDINIETKKTLIASSERRGLKSVENLDRNTLYICPSKIRKEKRIRIKFDVQSNSTIQIKSKKILKPIKR